MRALFGALLILATSQSVEAHEPSRSYLQLQASGESVAARVDLPLAELHHLIGLDPNGDGRITWGEVEDSHRPIEAAVISGVRLSAGSAGCPWGTTTLAISERDAGPFAVLEGTLACSLQSDGVDLKWTFFNDQNSQHQAIVRFEGLDGGLTRVVGATSTRVHFTTGTESVWQSFVAFVEQGAIHIFDGIDHLLFLCTLLLPAVLRQGDAQKNVFFAVAKIVTAFTIAHSITLTAATFNVIALPTRWIEVAIAATIVLAALNNIWPIVRRHLWAAAFGFGLIHGLGFANALREIALPQGEFAVALLGFNLGVEAGQLVVVTLLLPLLLSVRRFQFYPRIAMPAASAAIALLGLVWLAERAMAGP